MRFLRTDGRMSGFQEVLASKADSELFFQFFCTRRFLWKFEHSQLNTLALGIFHFDRGVFLSLL